MTIWVNTFILSMFVYMGVYVSSIGVLLNIPPLLIMAAIAATLLRTLGRIGSKVDRRISRPFMVAIALALVFTLKHMLFSGSTGLVLALKIFLYHATFLSGLLVGFYSDLPKVNRAWSNAILLFFVPLIFFLIFARGNPPHPELFVFNRNPFAGYIISASAILLGFGSRMTLIKKFPTYILLVCIALIFNLTLGALLAFLTAVLIYFGPSILLSRRLMMRTLGIALAVFLLLPLVLSLISGDSRSIEAFTRLNFVFGLFRNIFEYYDGSWLDFDMSTAVRFAPSGDLDMSAMFRILHWKDIFFVLADEGSMLLGGGTDWISENKYLFVYKLAAHNEYMRILVEQGLIYGLVLICAIWTGVWSLRKTKLFVPLAALTLYFGTENLMNDFATTSIYFFVLGHTIARCKRKLH